MGNKNSLMLQDDDIKQIGEETGFTPTQIEKLYTRFAQLDRSGNGALSKYDLLSIPELAINPLCDRLIHMFFVESSRNSTHNHHLNTSGDNNIDDNERINFRQFMRVLATFRPNSCVQLSSSNTNHSLNNVNVSQSQSQNVMLHSRQATLRSKSSERVAAAAAIPSSASIGLNESLVQKLWFVFRIYDVDHDHKISFGDLKDILKLMVGNYIDKMQLNKIAMRAFVEVDENSDGYIDFEEFCRIFGTRDIDEKLRIKFFE